MGKSTRTSLRSVAKILEREYVANRPSASSSGEGGAESPAVTGAAAERSATVRMRRVTGGGSVLAALDAAGQGTELATTQVLEATDYTYGRGEGAYAPTVPLEIEKAAIAEVAGGATPAHVEAALGIHRGYVRRALTRRFGSPEAAKKALQGLVLENALACQEVAAEKISDMTGPQAVMAGAILIDKSLALEKSIQEAPKTIDFGALADMAKTLKVLREIASESEPES